MCHSACACACACACALQALGEELPQLPPTTPRHNANGNVGGATGSSNNRGAAEAAAVPVLAKAFHEALAAREIPFEIARQIVPGGARTREEMALQWVGCVLGQSLLGLSAFKALRSGERLCDLLNAIRPGLVSRVTRVESERSKGVSAQKLEVKQLENISRCLDSLSFLGLRSHDQFRAADLWEQRNVNAVINTIAVLGLLCASVPGYHGPVLSPDIPAPEMAGGAISETEISEMAVSLRGSVGVGEMGGISGAISERRTDLGERNPQRAAMQRRQSSSLARRD